MEKKVRKAKEIYISELSINVLVTGSRLDWGLFLSCIGVFPKMIHTTSTSSLYGLITMKITLKKKPPHQSIW